MQVGIYSWNQKGSVKVANEQNLIPEAHKLTVEEQSAGGKASGEARRRKKQLREILDELMERKAGKDSDGNEITTAEAMAIQAVKAAMNGDWKAWELVRDTAGQKPVDKVVIAEVEQSVIDEVERAVYNDEE